MTDSPIVSRVLAHNKEFVAEKRSTAFQRGKKPQGKLAVVACIDTRLITMLTAALGLDNGEANIIKVAGAEVAEPYGAVMRSLLIAIYKLDVTDIMIVAHTECGAQHMTGAKMKELMGQAGISDEAILHVAQDMDLDGWFQGFSDTEASVRKSVDMVKSHPLVPPSVNAFGFIIDTQTGELTRIV